MYMSVQLDRYCKGERWNDLLVPSDALGGVGYRTARCRTQTFFSNVSTMLQGTAIVGVKLSSSCPVHRWSQVRIVKVSVVGVPDGTGVLVMSRTQYRHVRQ